MQPNPTACITSIPEIPGSEIFGIAEGTVDQPNVTYLDPPLPVPPELLAAAAPVEPTEIFRFVGACLETSCQQFSQGQCQLAKRIVQGLPSVTQTLTHLCDSSPLPLVASRRNRRLPSLSTNCPHQLRRV